MKRKFITATLFTLAVLLALLFVRLFSVTGSLERIEKECDISLPKGSSEVFCEKHVFDRSARSKVAIIIEIPADNRKSFATELGQIGWKAVPVGKNEQSILELCKVGVDRRFSEELFDALSYPGSVCFSKDRFGEIYPGIYDGFDNRSEVFFTFAMYCPENGRLFYFEVDE